MSEAEPISEGKLVQRANWYRQSGIGVIEVVGACPWIA